MLFDPMTGKVIEENAMPENAEFPPFQSPQTYQDQGARGFNFEPAAIRSIMRAPAKMAAPMGDDEGEIFRGRPGHDPRDIQDGGWEPISAGDISSLARLGYRG